MIKPKRVYEEPSPKDGLRVLVNGCGLAALPRNCASVDFAEGGGSNRYEI